MKSPSRASKIVGALALALVASAGLAVTPPAQAAQNVVVTQLPDQTHPRVLNGRIYAIATAGDLVAVGGTFTSVRNGAGGSPDQARQWIFLYNKATGKIVESFNPTLRGPAPSTTGLVADQPGVEAIEFAPDGKSMYVAGWFTSVNGQSRQRVVRLNLDGSLTAGFSASVNNTVNDLALTGGRLIVGGEFSKVNQQPVERLVSLDPQTGATQSDFNLPLTDSRDEFAPYLQDMDASPDGKWLAIAGNFQTVGTVARNQVALIDLKPGGAAPRVANWSTDAYSVDCAPVYDDSWVRSVNISPDSSYMVVAGTGAFIPNTLCDSAARWELPPTQSGDHLSPTWKTLTGGDTFWTAEVTESAVYVGGHQRWVNNPRPSPGGDSDGPGSVERDGIVALDPLTGAPLSWNPGRDRGRGAEAITATDDFLLVGSDTEFFAGQLRQRLAPLPVAGGLPNPQPTAVDLPVTLNYVTGSQLRSVAFDGASFGSTSQVPASTGIDWSGFRGGFVQNGKLHYFGASQAFYSRPFSTSSIGSETNLSSTVGYVDYSANLTPYDQPYGVAETNVATYNPTNGQIYYVKSDGKLMKRGYSLESGIIDAGEQVASGRSFANARGLAFIGDWLYAAWSNGGLYRFYAPGGEVDFDNNALVDSSTTNWSQVKGLFAMPSSGAAVQPTKPDYSCSTSLPWRAKYWSNQELDGAPDKMRCEADVNYNYGSGAPADTNLPSNNFSASWTRSVSVPDGKALQVTATADDGVRVYVDGVRVINDWVDSSARTRTGTSAALSGGDHTVRVEFYENSGGAQIQVSTTVVDAPAAPLEPDNIAPDTTVSGPQLDDVVASGPVTFTGTATDNRSITSVRVAIYNRDDATNRWLQPNGTWGPSYAYRSPVLAEPGVASTTWSIDITLPEGNFAVDAVAVDGVGNVDLSSVFRRFSVNDNPVQADTQAPVVAVTSPVKRDTVRTTSFTASGTSGDNRGVDSVRVAVRNRTTGDWLQDNGSWAPGFASRNPALASPGATSSTWSLPLTLATGSYALDVRATDTSGNQSPSTYHPFEVDASAPDNQAPSTTVASPAKNATVGSPVTFTGTSTDNKGVSQMRVAIYNRVDSTNKWLQANGTWGPSYAFRSATLANPGATSTGWSISIPLPDGLYGLDAKAVDTSDNKDPSSPFVPFQVGNDQAAPVAKVAKRSAQVSGVASDDSSVRKVQVEVKKAGKGKKKWVTKKGRLARKSKTLSTTLAAPGARTSRWALGLDLSPGKYVVYVTPVDGTRNSPAKPLRKRIKIRG
ncbi:PA14 domain-containing protein [Nocardioides sp.]|uniref:PA14 domain-containing protein n=1 Tax=Nocardioides sp. TaxID=35761 RepID=UPI000C93AA9F|nr:hypothetical protein [Pimelobacter sp.]